MYLFQKSRLKNLLREQDGIPHNIKLEFLKRYTANCIKISELKRRKKSSAVYIYIKFLKNTNSKTLVKLYKNYRTSSETSRLNILETLYIMDRLLKTVNLSVTISEINSTLK